MTQKSNKDRARSRRPDPVSKKTVLKSFDVWFVIPCGDRRPDFVATDKKTALEMSEHPETGDRYCVVEKWRIDPTSGSIKFVEVVT